MKLCYYEHDYEADKARIIDTDGDRFTVKVKPEVTIPRFVVLVDEDTEYNVEATLDFSKVPARWHGLALEMALGWGRSKLDLPRRVR